MVNKDEFINGILRYIDKEVIPVLPTSGKWGLGTIIALGADRYSIMLDDFLNNPFIKSIAIIDENEKIDLDKLAKALECSAEKYGKLVMTIPIIGTLAFTDKDVEVVKKYIEGGI